MKMTGNAHHDANCIQIFGKGMKMANEICEKHKVVGCQDCKTTQNQLSNNQTQSTRFARNPSNYPGNDESVTNNPSQPAVTGSVSTTPTGTQKF
jgi:hypothetical protein